MANFGLSIRPTDLDEERLNMFTKEVERTEEITNEDLQAAEKKMIDEDVNQFFGLDGGLEEMVSLYADVIGKLEEERKDEVLKEADLIVETEDPFLIKRFEADQKVYHRAAVEHMKEEKKGSLPYSTSTDEVKKTGSGYYAKTTGTTYGSTTYGTTGKGGYGSTTSGNNAKKSDEPRKLGDDLGFIAGKIQDVGAQKIPGYNDKYQDEGWGKPTWKRRIRNFFKSKKFRILTKFGMLMALQLGMAVVGKRYEFEGFGHMMMFLGMMMGVFYLTRELVEDGFDPRGTGIL